MLQNHQNKHITLSGVEESIIARVIEFLYTDDYGSSYWINSKPFGQSQQAARDESPFAIHAKMYAAATKYDVSGLNQLAQSQYIQLFANSWSPREFLTSIPLIYSDNSISDDSLRRSVARNVRPRLSKIFGDSLISDLWRQTCLEIPEFALDVLNTYVQNPRRQCCSSCGRYQGDDRLRLLCHHCQETRRM